jgi:hypothetical protein
VEKVIYFRGVKQSKRERRSLLESVFSLDLSGDFVDFG